MLQPEYLDKRFASFNLEPYIAQSLRFTPPDDEVEVIPVTEYLQADRLLTLPVCIHSAIHDQMQQLSHAQARGANCHAESKAS
jgi:hypothetical protein